MATPGGAAPLDRERFAKNRGKRGRKSGIIGEKREQNQEEEVKSGRFFHFVPSDRSGRLYATAEAIQVGIVGGLVLIAIVSSSLLHGCSQTFCNEGEAGGGGEGSERRLKMAALHRLLYNMSFHGGPGF